MPLTLPRCILYWYHLYINHPGGRGLGNTVWEIYFWKVLATQVEMSIKTCNKFQQFKKRKTIYGNLPPKIIESLKSWRLVYINLIGPYSKSIIKEQSVGVVINKYVSLTHMTIIYPATGRFKIVKIPCFDPE